VIAFERDEQPALARLLVNFGGQSIGFAFNDGVGAGNAQLYYEISIDNVTGSGLTFVNGELTDMDFTGDVTINVHPYTDGSSLYLEDEDSDVNGVPRLVPGVTIDAVCNEMGLPGPYLLKIDVQGFEDAVLDGVGPLWRHVAGVQVELALTRLYAGERGYLETCARLESLGFALALVLPGYFDGKVRRQLQFDGVFLRAGG